MADRFARHILPFTTDAPRAGDGVQVPLGTREHVQRTLDRAREAIRRARERKSALTALFAEGRATVTVSRQLVAQSEALRADLRASVGAYARALHDAGEPPQRMLVLVKEVVCAAIPPECDTAEHRALLADVVRWSVEAYYPVA